MSPPSNWWDTRPLKKRFGTFITRFISSGDYQDLCHADPDITWIKKGHGVLLEEPPKVERGKQPRGHEESELADICPSGDKTSQRVRQGTLPKRELAEEREAHWQALVAAIALEERIGGLSWSITRSRPDTHAHSQSCNWWRRRSWGQSRRCCRALPEDNPSFLPCIVPLSGAQTLEDQEAELPFLEFDLGLPPELGTDVEHFFQELATMPRGDVGSNPSQESWQKTMKCGSSGGDVQLIHLIGGKSWWRFQG